MTATRTTNIAKQATAQKLEWYVMDELSDRYGLYFTDGDSLDLDPDNNLVLVNSAGDIGYLPVPEPLPPRYAALIVASIYLRDGDS